MMLIGLYRSSWLNYSCYASFFAIATQSGKKEKKLAIDAHLNQIQIFAFQSLE
jgi:hypothetical protein